MIWEGALQKTGSMSRLQPHQGDVRAVTVYTHGFVLGKVGGLADDREDPFYTATGNTPEEAEATAHMVYLRALSCHHQMSRKTPTLLECRKCGVQQRTTLTASDPKAAKTAAHTRQMPPERPKPERRFFGLF